MNYAIVFRLLSYILFCEAALLLLPATASLCYGEWSVLGVFVLTAALCLVLGLLLRRIKPSSKVFYMRGDTCRRTAEHGAFRDSHAVRTHCLRTVLSFLGYSTS